MHSGRLLLDIWHYGPTGVARPDGHGAATTGGSLLVATMFGKWSVSREGVDGSAVAVGGQGGDGGVEGGWDGLWRLKKERFVGRAAGRRPWPADRPRRSRGPLKTY